MCRLKVFFLLIALVIARITLNVIVRHVVKLKHFDDVFATGGGNTVEVVESLTTSV